ncbi:MAG: germination protein YpeB [Firmicutes bacterium]|nr:germination protein YpeB [Bacillota bacterium]
MEDTKSWGKRHWYTSLLTIALIGVTIWGLAQYRGRIETRNQLENTYQRSFYDLVNNMENIDVLIAKGLVSTSPSQDVLYLANTWKESSSAQENLNQLPIDHFLLGRTTKFINQTGDFTYTLARQVAEGKEISTDQRNSLLGLQKEADYLVRELQGLREQIRQQHFAWGSLNQQGSSKFREASPAVSNVSFQQIDNELQGLPTMIYDGPFSDHIDKITPRGLSGNPITVEEANRIAMEKADLTPGVKYTSGQVGTGEGRIPVYRIEITPSEGASQDRIDVDVSRTGGHIVNFLNSRPLGKGTLDNAQVEAKANEYLKSRGFTHLIGTYSQLDDTGSCAIVSFAGYENGIILYPDQVKVKVALDNGQIIGLDNTGYLISHYERNIPAPKVKEDDILIQAAKAITVEKVRLALIPMDSKREVLCYEAKGTVNDETYYLYYNAENGSQEKVLKVIKTQQGQLTM